MFERLFHLLNHSFFRFGSRGTGKTTWLRHVLPDALCFDLLRTQTFLALTRQPDSFRQQVEARPKGNWIVVDEVQRLPSLLNEVHALIAERGRAYRFALSGSSARKLKRMDVNLLAGQGYFATLVDTLIGTWLPAWRKRAKVKEVASPKFYLFDPGVVRALAGRLREPLDAAKRGFQLETWILHELRAAMASQDTGGHLHYWRTPSGREVDFVWTRGPHTVGFEVKAATTWRNEFGASLKALIALGRLQAGYGTYLGAAELEDGPLRVFPLKRFLKELVSGHVLVASPRKP